MSKMNVSPYFFAIFILIMTSGSAMAEYRAITKFPTPEAGRDKNGKPLELPDRQADETDFKACQAITDNINAMEKYHVQWECDFPISANNYLLSKPQWTEVTGEEKGKALAVIKQEEDIRPVFSFPYNADAIDGDEKIYKRPLRSEKWKCTEGNTDYRSSLWFSEKNNLNLYNNDIVVFASRLYFVAYNQTGGKDKSFYVTTLKAWPWFSPDQKFLTKICSIRL